MSISDKFNKLEKEIDKAGIDAYRTRHDSGQNMDSERLSTDRFYLDSIKYATNGLTPVSDSYKNQALLDNEIGTSLPKNIKNVASNFKREMGKQPMDSEYLFHFCDNLPNGHDLTDDELGWPNGISITITRYGKVVAVMEDMKYVEVNQPQFNSMPTLDHIEFYPNPTRYILRQDSILYVSEDLNQWKKLNIGDLCIYENQICCDHDGIVYLLCDNNIVRVIDPDKYAYGTDGSVPIYNLTIAMYPGQDLNQYIPSVNNTWITVGTSGTILRSTNNGLTWTKIDSGMSTSYGLLSIHYSNNTWIIAGFNGIILRSTDDGLSWTQITVSGVSNDLYGISYSNNTWIIAGFNGTILRSIDDGLNWTKITSVSDNLRAIYYSNNTWIAVGHNGTILRSTDDGLNWTKITVDGVIGVLLNIRHISNSWIIIGQSGVILRSIDNGLTWTIIPSGVSIFSLNSVDRSNNTWIIVGDEGTILRSTDNGLNWTKISVDGITHLLSIHYSNNTWIIAGFNGIILRSTDDGLNWTKITSGTTAGLYNIISSRLITFLRYGGTQFRTNYNFAEYFVSNTTPPSIAGNVIGGSDTEEPGFVGKIDPLAQFQCGSTGTNRYLNASKKVGFNILQDGDLIALGGTEPFFITDNPMDLGVPARISGISGASKDLDYDLCGGLAMRNGIISYYLYRITGTDSTYINDDVIVTYPNHMSAANSNRLTYEGSGKYPYIRYDRITGTDICDTDFFAISTDIIHISRSEFFIVGRALSDGFLSLIRVYSYSDKPGGVYTETTFHTIFSNLSWVRDADTHAHMVRGGDKIYIWVNDSQNRSCLCIYNMITDDLVEYAEGFDVDIPRGPVRSVCASNAPHTIRTSDGSQITSDVFIVFQNDTAAPEYYYIDYAYDDMARLVKFDPGNKYTASQTAGETMTRMMVRFNDKSIYYNHGNVFIRLDYYDSNTSADDYLGPIKHKYLMCGLNNTSSVLRKIESTDMRTGSFMCTSMKMNVPFTKRNTLNAPTKMQLSDYPSEEFTPDIIILYNEEFNYGSADSDTLGITPETGALSNTSFAMVFTKDIYSLDGDSYTNQNPDFGTTIVRNGSLENGVRYVTRGLQNNPIDLILYHDHMEINLSSEFLGTKISYLAIGQRGAALYPYN